MANHHLRNPVLLSLLAAILTLGLKWRGYYLTGSVSILSDAAEGLVNLFAAGANFCVFIDQPGFCLDRAEFTVQIPFPAAAVRAAAPILRAQG